MRNKFFIAIGLLSISMLANGKTDNQKIANKKSKLSIPGALNTSNANSFPKGKTAITLKSQIFTKDKLYSGNEKIRNAENEKNEIFNNTLTLRYGISKKSSIKILFPISKKSFRFIKPEAKETVIKNSGLGDIKTFFEYSLKSENNGDKYSALLELGITVPTGKSDKIFIINTKEGVNKGKKPYGMQSGNGSFDYSLKLNLSKQINKSRFSFSTLYTFNTKGDNELKSGNEFHYNIAYVNKLFSKLAIQTEINGKNSEKHIIAGEKSENSGGSIIYITPGVIVNTSKKIIIAGGIQIPLYKNLYGEQIAEDYRIISKISYRM